MDIYLRVFVGKSKAMQIINDVPHYSLIEMQLRLHLGLIKDWFGKPDSQHWQDVLDAVTAKKSQSKLTPLYNRISHILHDSDNNSFCIYKFEEPRFPESLAELFENLVEDQNLYTEGNSDYFAEKEALIDTFKGFDIAKENSLEKLMLDEFFRALSGIKENVAEVLIQKICQGKILAYGIRFPLLDKPALAQIPQLEWMHLVFQDSEAVPKNQSANDKYKYGNLIFTVIDSETFLLNSPKYSKSGRPSLMKEIKNQLQKKIDENEKLGETLVAETHDLEAWAKKTYPKLLIPQPKSIAKNKDIRALYHKLKSKPQS